MLRVVTPPSPIVTPVDIAGDHADDDSAVMRMIAAVTEEIDGPTGWLGRCLGPQELEYAGWIGCGRFRLPCGPIIAITSVSTEDCDGTAATVDPSLYRLADGHLVVAAGVDWVRRPLHRVRYKAGYNGTSGAGDGELQTGPVPERARQAIILSVQHMKALGAENLFLRSVEVPDVLTEQYTLSDAASRIVQQACDRLWSGLRVYSL